MKVANKKATALVEGEVESVKMTVDESGLDKMCRFLRDDIYTQKEWAVVREILANAVDEHAMHGIDRPVEVTLPTFEDPHFRVRDFAKGLSKEMVFSVFFQYFKSTKDQDNANIGGFGIGAKSPLAYADMFFVDSYHDGVKTSYASNINGEASVAHKMGLSDSNETGIEVAVPVEQSDFETFYALVGEFIHFGDYQDTIKVLNDDLTKYPKSDWQIVNDLGKTGHSHSRFTGNSYRPILGRIKGILYQVPEHNDLSNPFHNDLIVDLDPELDWDIHPSRERLQATKRNILLIQKAVKAFADAALSETKAKIAKAKTAREKFAVEFDASAFRQSVHKEIEMPELLKEDNKEVEFITWDASDFDRYKCNKMSRAGHWKSEFHFTPSRMVRGIDSYSRTDYWKNEGSILFVRNKTVRTYEVIAYAEKNNIPSPLFVFRGERIPEGWVESEDCWVLRDGDVAKDETAAIKKRYNPQGAAKRGSTGSGIPASEVIGYKSSYRSTYNVIRMQDIDDQKEILVVPLVQSREISNIVPSCHGYWIEELKKDFNILFCFQTQEKRLQKAKVEYKTLTKGFLKPYVQEYLNANQSVEPMSVRKYADEHTGYKVGSHPNPSILASIKQVYGDMKATKENPVIAKLREAQKRYDALDTFEQELVEATQDWSVSRTFKAIKAKGDSILKDKIFI